MKILLIGASGYLGSAILDNLTKNGHQVAALVRNPRPLPEGVEARTADLAHPDTLGPAVTPDIDGVVHAGAPLGNWDLEDRAVTRLLDGLADADKPFIYLSGIWVLGASEPEQSSPHVLDESSPVRPIALVSGRERLEHRVLHTGRARGIVIRPGIVHGRGGGIPGLMTSWPEERGHGVFVSTGGNSTWPVVHVDDLAALVHLALLNGGAGQILHGVAEPAVPVPEVAAAADLAAGGIGQAKSWPFFEAAKALTKPFAEALALSQRAAAPAADALGWKPLQPGIVSDLRHGSYPRATQPEGV